MWRGIFVVLSVYFRPVILWIYPPQIAIVMKLGIFASFDPCNNIVKVKENRGIGTLPNFGIPVFFRKYEIINV